MRVAVIFFLEARKKLSESETKSKKGIDNRIYVWYNRSMGKSYFFYGMRSLRTILDWERCFLPTERLIQHNKRIEKHAKAIFEVFLANYRAKRQF